jgi:nitrite reductase/ring-hydroxylating ferredoxin subunit
MLVPLGDPAGRDCWLLKGSRDPLLLAVRFDGEVRVMDGLCPHAEAPMATALITEAGDLMCPLHWWRFDPRTGAGLTDSRWPLELYEVVEVDGELHAVVPED